MIGGAAGIRVHHHGGVLRIGHDKVVRESGSAVLNQTAGFPRNRRLSVESACELAGIAVGEKCLEDGVRTERCRSRDGCANDSGPQIESFEHGIEQGRVKACPSQVERVQYSVFVNVHIVDRESAVQVRAFAADISGLEREVVGQFALNLKVEVLNVRVYSIV